MSTTLFDVQTGCGGTTHGKTDAVGVHELLAELERVDIAEALVRVVPEDSVIDVPSANQAVYEYCNHHTRLFPCPIVVPNGGGELPSEAEQVDEAIAHGAGAAMVRPSLDYWSLEAWSCDRLFHAMEERRLPAYCQADHVMFEQAAVLAHRYPRMPIIIAGVEYRNDRVLMPMMRRFPNVYLSIGSNYTVHQGIERFVAEVGPERLLFGTGFPQVETMAAIAMLMYADISEGARQDIGAGNMERLIAGIQR